MTRTISPNEFYDRKCMLTYTLEKLLGSEFFEKMMTRRPFIRDITTILDFLLNGIKNKRILDVGCGGGDKCEDINNFSIPSLSISLSTLGANVVGIDLYAKPKNQYYRKFEAYKMAAEDIDKKFREGEFDAVVALEFWNSPTRLGRIDRISDSSLCRIDGNYRQKLQIEKDEEQLRKLYKVLRVGGIYIDGLKYEGKIDEDIFRKIGFEDLSSYFIKEKYSTLDSYTIGRKPQQSN